MFLRSLTLKGFKSFADRTTLEFTPGVSVIVGPNGSGKSNIADAIAWVLGEQGPRALRGAQMTDVIFAGGPTRKPLGLAEVRMVIDNSAGLIPVPASEIEISRTVYRSGESEYRLGGRPCRLLDIQELLSDTGMGRALHTIVGQGQLDAVLGARPEERRQFVEEAAGIAKHRRRRERAERKLTGLEADLNRLQDLVGELRRQLKPLKQQAELAGRHEALTSEAAQLARKLAAARLRELYRERERRGPSWNRAEAEQAAIRSRMEELDAEIARLESERLEAEAARRAAEELHAARVDAKSAAEGRLRDALRDEARTRERMAAAGNRPGRLFALEEELDRTERALADVLASVDARTKQLEEAERDYRAAEQVRRDAEEDRRRSGEQALAHRAQADALSRSLSGDRLELERLVAAGSSLGERAAEARGRLAELAAEIERLDGRGTPLADRLSAMDRERAELAVAMADLEAEEKGLLARQEVVDARREELAESPGAAFLRRNGERPIGLLKDLIEAPADLRHALRAALGPFADAPTYATSQDAFADAEAESTGGTTLAIEGGPDHTLPSVYGERSLFRAVRPDPRVRRLAGALLGEIYVVANLAEARAKHRVHPYATFVALDGAMAGPSFVRTPPGADVRLDQVRRESASIERELSGIRRRLREGRVRLRELVEGLEVGRGELEETDRLITTAAEASARTDADLASLRREEQVVAERVAAVEAQAQVSRERLAAMPAPATEQDPLPPRPEAPLPLRVEVEAMRRECARLEAGVVRARGELKEVASEDPIALREELVGAQAERVAAEESLRDAEGNLDGAAAAHRAAAEAARAVEDRYQAANRSWREAASAVERLRAGYEAEDRVRHDLERRVEEAERLLRDGHGAEPAGAVAELAAEDTPDELAKRSDVVARRMGLLGRVNLLATGELESVQQRHDFLVRELEDVRSARRDLERVIDEVDRQVAAGFGAAFEAVAQEFGALFGLMFPGGEGRLTLTDPSDLLGTGIEVEARPGRGRVRRLSLLSGGERSLAALAFLFAIFKALPSPFYLMDEVEAALDDVNLLRFLELLRGFAGDSQILIVSHQKRTMETGDVLYGVSMGRDGASTVISQRLVEATVH